MEYPYEAIREVIAYAEENREEHRKDNGEKVSRVRLVPGHRDADVVVDFEPEEG